MLWYNSWLETRWRFAIGLIIVTISACGSVAAYPQMLKLLPLADKIETSGALARLVVESAELARTYRGYLWSQWFLKNMPQQGAVFAVLIRRLPELRRRHRLVTRPVACQNYCAGVCWWFH